MERRQVVNDTRWGLRLAVASLAVNAPRLMLVYMKADGALPPMWFETFIIGLSGVANGIVLAGAGIVIAHTLARADSPGVHPAVRPLMLVTWLVSLLFATILITPAFVSGIRGVALNAVLQTNLLQWGWSAVAVVAVEVAAAGSMLADAALNGRRSAPRKSQVRISEPESEPATALSEPPANVIPLLTAQKVTCDECGKLINDTKNARNAHARFCKGKRTAAG